MTQCCFCSNADNVSTIECPGCSRIFHKACAGFPSDVVWNIAKKYWKCYNCSKDNLKYFTPLLESVKKVNTTKILLDPDKCIEKYDSENGIFYESFNGYSYFETENRYTIKINDKVFLLVNNNHGFDRFYYICVVLSYATTVYLINFVKQPFSTHHSSWNMCDIHKRIEGWKRKKKKTSFLLYFG